MPMRVAWWPGGPLRARERRKHASAAAGSSGDNYRGKMRHGAAHTKPPRPSAVRPRLRCVRRSVPLFSATTTTTATMNCGRPRRRQTTSYGRVNSEFQSSTRGENKRTGRTSGLRKRGAPDRERDKIAFLRKDGGERGHGSERGGDREESVNRGVTAPSADL